MGHSKLVFCPIMQAVTLIDPDKVFHTFRFQDLNERGYPYKFNRLLKSAEKMMSTLLRDIITPSAGSNSLTKYVQYQTFTTQYLKLEYFYRSGVFYYRSVDLSILLI